MQLHQLKRRHPREKPKLVGRGGKRGTTSGRGTKGQRARSGHRIRPEIRDVIKRLPKLRGHMSLAAPDLSVAVTLADLVRHFRAGETVSPASLKARRLIAAGTLRRGTVKIIGATPLPHALTIEGCFITRAARRIIEAAGGKVANPVVPISYAK